MNTRPDLAAGDEERTHWHAIDAARVESMLDTSPHGLTKDEAVARIERYGPNRLQEVKPPGALTVLLHQFQSPLIYILLVATVVTLALQEYIDSGVIAFVLALNAVIGFVQEKQAEESVRALMKLVSPKARVVREGHEWEVDSTELVPGDVVFLESGTRVPADIRLFSATSLAIDESLLTGESLPVAKRVEPVEETAGVADRACMAYTGAIVTGGRGRGYVVETGPRTELGSIAEQVRGEEEIQTPMQQRMGTFAQVIGIVVGIASLLAFIIGIILGESVSEMFKVAVALAVAAVPEGLPVVFTITLALGVRRMAHRNAIIRRLPAVETLGSTSVIGSDKTGTLTENRMTVQEIWAGGESYSLAGDGAGQVGDLGPDHPLALALTAGILTNEAEVFMTEEGVETRGDPTEAAILVAAAELGIEPEDVRDVHPAFAEIPFEPELRYSASIREKNGAHLVAVKGAPERVMLMCSHMLTSNGPTPVDESEVMRVAAEMASKGLRVLAAAHRVLPEPLDRPDRIEEPEALTLLGLFGMMDPPRKGVEGAIAGCRSAGIRVLMITGDHARTALAIGRKLGLAGGDNAPVTGSDIDQMDEERLAEVVRETSIYARMSPENKLQVVRALREQGDVVAVTGDGVNDAPALRAADIGISMGKSGTDVAREASDMVLTDDDFVSIYAAVEEGRVTFDNLRKATFFLISTGAASIVVILTALAFRWPLPFLPAQLLWLNLVTNGLQDVALAFEPGEKGVLRRPPRSRTEGIISRILWERVLIAGLVMAIGTLALFRWTLDSTDDLVQAQSVALTTMVLFMMLHVGNSRSEYISAFRKNPISNPFLFIATAAALIVHIGALYLGPTQYILRVEPIGLDAWVRMLAVALSIIAAVEVHKLLRRNKDPARAYNSR